MTKVFYIIAILSLIISFIKSREKTKMVLKKAWKSFENIMPQFLSIILLIGVMLAVLTPEQISMFLGKESGIMVTIIRNLSAFVFSLVVAMVMGGSTMIKNFVKRYRFFLILLVINISLLFISPEIGKKSFSITYDNLLEMLGVIPPIFILLGVLIVGIPVIAFIISVFLKEKDKEEIYSLAQERE